MLKGVYFAKHMTLLCGGRKSCGDKRRHATVGLALLVPFFFVFRDYIYLHSNADYNYGLIVFDRPVGSQDEG